MSSPPRTSAALTRLFTPAGIAVGTLLGSLIAAVMMMWMNYRVLGYRTLGNRFMAGGILVYVVVLVLATVLPRTPTVGVVVLALQCAAAWWAASTLQGNAIDYHRAHGGAVHGLAVAAGAGFVVFLVTTLMLVLIGQAFGLPIAIR
jgi:hypothetical protein